MTGDGQWLCATVEDQGEGFDSDSVFQPDDELTGGFGLFSIRERLGLLGGRLDIESRKGKGSHFRITAPSGMVPQVEVEDSSPSSDQDSDRSVATGKTRAPINSDNNLRLLIVDDHEVVRQRLCLLLSQDSRIKVAGEATNGLQAVELARSLHPDIILMDFSMPEMDGVEATRRIHQEMPDIPVIGLSMYDEQDRAAAMLEAGAATYLTKSGESDALLQAIHNLSG